jgi:hypothetical protein
VLWFPTPQPQSATPIIISAPFCAVAGLPCNNNHQTSFSCVEGWTAMMDELLFVTCFSVISLQKKKRKKKKSISHRPLWEENCPIVFRLVTCKTIEMGRDQFSKSKPKRNVQPWKEGPTAEWNETQFLIDFLFLSHFFEGGRMIDTCQWWAMRRRTSTACSTSCYFVDHRDYIAIGETKQKFVVSSSLHSDTWV